MGMSYPLSTISQAESSFACSATSLGLKTLSLIVQS